MNNINLIQLIQYQQQQQQQQQQQPQQQIPLISQLTLNNNIINNGLILIPIQEYNNNHNIIINNNQNENIINMQSEISALFKSQQQQQLNHNQNNYQCQNYPQHRNNKQAQQCDITNVFKDISSLSDDDQNESDYKEPKSCYCPECGKHFKCKYNLISHKKIYHQNGRGNTFPSCRYCGKEFIRLVTIIILLKIKIKIK